MYIDIYRGPARKRRESQHHRTERRCCDCAGAGLCSACVVHDTRNLNTTPQGKLRGRVCFSQCKGKGEPTHALYICTYYKTGGLSD